MKFTIIYGKDDPAGNNIIQNLKQSTFLPQTQIIKIKKHPIYLTFTDMKKLAIPKDTEFIIFASTHRSEKNEKSLSLHAPGNWRNADLGGLLSSTSKFGNFGSSPGRAFGAEAFLY